MARRPTSRAEGVRDRGTQHQRREAPARHSGAESQFCEMKYRKCKVYPAVHLPIPRAAPLLDLVVVPLALPLRYPDRCRDRCGGGHRRGIIRSGDRTEEG